MKIKRLKIENFKAIRNIELDNLSNTVLIAGPNGCGKSCIFDSIRLLKSLIGEYQDNELNSWFQEFQIKKGNIHKEIVKFFQNQDKDLKIEASFKLDDIEKDFLRNEGEVILSYRLWRQAVPQYFTNQSQNQNQNYRSRPLGIQYNQWAQQISIKSKSDFNVLKKELNNEEFKAQITIYKNGQFTISSPNTLQLVFILYEEKNLGVIDYHGPHRNYQKEILSNINLDIQTNRQSMKSHSLYNYQNKYNNIKQELAADYIRRSLIQSAGGVVVLCQFNFFSYSSYLLYCFTQKRFDN